MNILFVCTGNTCRSPMAEKMLKRKLLDEKLNIVVKSAGIAAVEGSSYSKHAETIIKNYLDEGHISQKVSEELMDWADLILTMTNGHKQILNILKPEHIEKIHTLKEYVLLDDAISLDIVDPFGKGLETYQIIEKELEELISKLLIRINSKEIL
ncbi:MAG: low molecular weight protein arginine phosphatase [Vulcanibacillus sp.]